MKISIIGAGIGGLATAALLAKDGHQVTVIEKNEQPGGRASQLKKDDFIFDMGPSWYLAPDIFEKFYALFGTTPEKEMKLQRLRPQYKVVFADGEAVEIPVGLKNVRKLFEELEPGCGPNFDRFMAESKYRYDLAMDKFLYRNIDSWWELMSFDFLKAAPRLGLHQNYHEYVKQFFKSPKIHQLLEYTLVFLGASPYNAPAFYSLMAYMDYGLGVWYPQGGMYAIVESLVRLGEQQGVKYVYNQPVTKILVEGDRVTGVKTSKQTYAADVVISNADYAFTDDILSDQSKRNFAPEYWQHRTWGPSALLLYLGVKGKLDHIPTHLLYFSDEWFKHFEEVFVDKELSYRPSIYISKRSQIDTTAAPKGHENVVVLVPIAAGLSETEQQKQEYAQKMLEYIDELGLISPDQIVTQEVFSVSDFEERYNSYAGTALGLAHTLGQSAVFRPGNKNKHLQNLFYVGGNTGPGIGVPMCLISAELVKQRLAPMMPAGQE